MQPLVSRISRLRIGRSLLCLAVLSGVPGALWARDEARIDLLSFAAGAVPVQVASAPADLKVGEDQAIAVVDGNWAPVGVSRKPATPEDVIEMTFALPAPTRFEAFSVPNVLETRSPSQTFVQNVEVLGAKDSPDGPFVPLASIQLEIHEAEGQETALTLSGQAPAVKWVRLRLWGGTDIQVEKSFLEFSEIIGTGAQEEPPLTQRFNGVFSGRGVKLELQQSGAVVHGCYDGTSELKGTVEGNILRALGQDPAGVPSQFILVAGEDGRLQGLRSSNGAPFRPYSGTPSDKAASCVAPEAPPLGCGAILHGIGFDFDSDVIRPGSRALLEELHAGLRGEGDVAIEIVGHSSSEGAADYNRDLSQRRAAAVVEALAALGLDAGRMSATGRGEDEPIASNADEAGRSLNRRVEVHCAG